MRRHAGERPERLANLGRRFGRDADEWSSDRIRRQAARRVLYHHVTAATASASDFDETSSWGGEACHLAPFNKCPLWFLAFHSIRPRPSLEKSGRLCLPRLGLRQSESSAGR